MSNHSGLPQNIVGIFMFCSIVWAGCYNILKLVFRMPYEDDMVGSLHSCPVLNQKCIVLHISTDPKG